MASASLIPKNGAIAVAGYLMDFSAFSIRSSQAVENVTPYGANLMQKMVGSGTPGLDITIAAFALAHATNTPLSLTAISATGVVSTLTLDTGVTESGGMVISSIEVGHRRMGAAVPVGITGASSNDWTETWATT